MRVVVGLHSKQSSDGVGLRIVVNYAMMIGTKNDEILSGVALKIILHWIITRAPRFAPFYVADMA